MKGNTRRPLRRFAGAIARTATLLVAALCGCAVGDDGFLDVRSDRVAVDTMSSDTSMMDAAPDALPVDAPSTDAADTAPRDTPAMDAPRMDVSSGCPDVDRGLTCALASPQCGCASGQMCIVDFGAPMAGARTCVPAGTTPVGGVCTAPGTCVAGAECTGGAMNRFCRSYCDPTADRCGTGRLCIQLNDAMMRPIPNAGVCIGGCTPVPNSGCMSAAPACRLASYMRPGTTTPTFFGDCDRAGTVAHRGACMMTSDCQASMLCLAYTFPDGGMAGNFCTRLCRVGMDTDCATAGTDRRCTVFMDHPRIGGVEYGACGP